MRTNQRPGINWCSAMNEQCNDLSMEIYGLAGIQTMRICTDWKVRCKYRRQSSRMERRRVEFDYSVRKKYGMR